MGFHLSQRSRDRLIGVDERLIKVAEKAIQITKVDFGIPEYGGRRTVEEQRHLYVTEKSKADGIHHKSYHQTGRAVDFYAISPSTGLASWDMGDLAQVAAAFFQAAVWEEVHIEWGGLWKNFVDGPHIQLVREG